ncbi:VOC family protein [Antrihabitans stalactiti]|uniref:VOC family protein n=1 Tax=Antrihabitans stalactiti TaxID=2584121 RepID=A0A848KKF9_9NOCA|nr:VOC family protein [Antrihabitans stalactiti]NMN97172.1 VOC family protein [Antrihabitans stalactiti]
MPSAQLRGVTVDCDDPESLSRFYQKLTGMTVGFRSDEYVALTGGAGPAIGFQRVENYRAPQWPGQQIPQQLHLDFAVEDLGAAVELMLSLGATRPQHQPGGDRYRVLLDPAGHPFCLQEP